MFIINLAKSWSFSTSFPVPNLCALTHDDKVENEDDILRVLGVPPEVGGVEPGVDDQLGGVRAVGVNRPLLVLQVDGLDLEQLDHVVEDREDDDGDNVAKTIVHLALLEGEANRDEPLH